MKLFIKRDTSVEYSAFSIYDESARLKYTAEFQKNSPMLKIFLKNTENNSQLIIRRFVVSGVCVYSLRQKGKNNINLVLKKSKDRVLCHFYGNNWHICGDVLSKNFKIVDVDNTVLASHQRAFAKRNESYELVVSDKANEACCVAAAVCIDLINIVDNPAVQAV